MTTATEGVDEGQLLIELTREVTSSLDLQEVLDKSLQALRRLIDFNGGSIQLIEDGALRMVAGDPPPPPEAFAFRLPLGQGFGGRVAETGELIYSPDATTDPRAHPEGRKRASVAGTHSWFGAPLIVHGQTIGVVQLDDLAIDHFPPPVQARILAFLPTVSAAVQNAQLYQQERDVVVRLRETERLKRDFVATVSHELKTPLTVVRGFAALLAEGDKLNLSQVPDIGRRIQAAALRLESLVTDVLQISGIEQGHLAVNTDLTDVAGLLRSVADGCDRGTHTLELTVAPDLPSVVIDGNLLGQVLTRLLDNAQRFSPAGKTIVLSASTGPDGVVEVAVADEGRGIPEAMAERIFEPFFQVDSSDTRDIGGLGTGLFLARRLCEAMGATLAVTSEVGSGSRFVVTLATAA